jgi:hypothetical protein
MADGDGAAVISAADEINGWSAEDLSDGRSIYKAPMSWTLCSGDGFDRAGMDQIFVDGEMMIESRWPDLPDSVNPAAYHRQYGATASGATTTNLTTTTYNAPELSSLPAGVLDGALFHAIAGAFWTPMTGSVTFSNGSSITCSHPGYGDEIYYRPREGDYFYVWGTRGLLDSPREWHRAPNGTLYLWLRDGGDPSAHLVEAKRRQDVLVLEGKSYLTFAGLKFLAGGIKTDDQTRWLLIDDIDCRYSSHYSLTRGPWSTRGVGVVLRGEGTVVRNSTFAYSAETVLLLTGKDAEAVNNVVHDGAYNGCDGYVLGINDAPGAQLRYNTAFGCGTNACIDLRRSTDCKVLYNDCFNGSRITCDGGMVMATRAFDAHAAEVAFNYIHDGQGLNDASRQFYGTSGFYCEGNTAGYVVHHNIIWNVTGSGIALGPGGEGMMSNFAVYNNTVHGFYASTARNITCGEFSGIIKNNSIGAVNKWSAFSGTVENNYTIDQDEPGSGNIRGADPVYADPDNYDFRPGQGSPLIDKGQVIDGITGEFTGSAPDIGALETGHPLFIAGAVITEKHIPELMVTWNEEDFPDKVFAVSGMPVGRKLPGNFKLKIGEASAGGTLSFNMKSGVFTLTGIPDGGQAGPQTIYGQIGEGTPAETGETIELGHATSLRRSARPALQTVRSRGKEILLKGPRGLETTYSCDLFSTNGRLILRKGSLKAKAPTQRPGLLVVKQETHSTPILLVY